MEAGRHTVTLRPWQKINNCTWANGTKSVRVKPSNAKHVPINNNTLITKLVRCPDSFELYDPDPKQGSRS